MKLTGLAAGALAAGMGLSGQEGPASKGEFRTLTHSIVLNAPKEKVFGFLSKVENLPKWAVVFCRGLEKRDGRWWVKTPQGEMLFRIDADPRTGVIDMFAGPAEDRMQLAPTRVVELPGKRSIFIFTVMQYPGMPDKEFEAQCVPLVEKEFPEIRRNVE
jgi:hypothetical protein